MPLPASLAFTFTSLLLSLLLIFILFFLYPLVKDYRIYSTAQVQKYGYLSVNGRVVDLHRTTNDRLKQIYSKYKGQDISSLVPNYLLLGRPVNTNTKWVYADRDINSCVNDALIADSWLMNLMDSINGTKVLLKDGALEKCANPITGALDEACLISAVDLKEMYKNTVGAKEVDRKVLEAGTRVMENSLVGIDNRVFDVTAYLTFATFFNAEEESKAGQLPSPRSGDTMFLPESVTIFFLNNMGQSRTFSEFASETKLSNPNLHLNCLRKLFFAGKLKTGPLGDLTPKDNWILLISSVLASFFVFTKILSSWIYPFLVPSNVRPASTSFIICVPLFNEPLSIIQRGLTHILSSDLPGGQSLLFVICDGNVQSQGEIKETHRVVLDHLNHPWHQCPGEAIDFLSLGEGVKQTNRGRVFYGTYTDAHGCYMPYIVLAKVGGPLEPYVSKPGTRGKRDSLFILLNFLSAILTKANSLSNIDAYLLETFLQVGVDPGSIEFLLNIDGDMLVEPNTISQLIRQMTFEPDLAACSGTLRADNGFSSIASMLESFHLFWTKHVLRSFESLTFQTQINTSIACYRVQKLHDPSRSTSSPTTPSTPSNSSLWLCHPSVISKFGMRYFNSILMKNIYQLGEDSMLASIIQEVQPHSNLRYLPSATSSVQIPNSFFNLLFRLKKEWIFNFFASIQVLYQPASIFHRSYAICSIFWKLTSPFILGSGYAMLAFAKAPFVMYALIVWGGIALFFLLGLLFFGRFDILFQFVLYLILGLPLHMILVPILSLIDISSTKWADQWPMSESIRNLQRSPGTHWDPILENIASSDKGSTLHGDQFSNTIPSMLDSNPNLSTYYEDTSMGPEIRQRKASRSYDFGSAYNGLMSKLSISRSSRPESSSTILSTSTQAR